MQPSEFLPFLFSLTSFLYFITFTPFTQTLQPIP